MINHRIAPGLGALLVFVQQLAHLIDRERRILPVKLTLTFTFIKERPVLRVRDGSHLLSDWEASRGPRAVRVA
jgi:hypothetical protein